MTHLLTQLRTEHMSHSMTWASEEQSSLTLEGTKDATERRPRTWQPSCSPLSPGRRRGGASLTAPFQRLLPSERNGGGVSSGGQSLGSAKRTRISSPAGLRGG